MKFLICIQQLLAKDVKCYHSFTHFADDKLKKMNEEMAEEYWQGIYMCTISGLSEDLLGR